MKYFRVGSLTITNQLLNPNSFCLLNGKTQFTTETHGVIVALFTNTLFSEKRWEDCQIHQPMLHSGISRNRLLVSHEITHETDTEGEKKNLRGKNN